MLLSRSGCNPGPTHSGTQIWLRSHRKQGGSYSSVIQPHNYRTSPDPTCHLLLPLLDPFLQINLQSSTIPQILTQSENSWAGEYRTRRVTASTIDRTLSTYLVTLASLHSLYQSQKHKNKSDLVKCQAINLTLTFFFWSYFFFEFLFSLELPNAEDTSGN